MEHNLAQTLVDKITKMVETKISRELLDITENNCLEPEDKVGHIRFMAENLRGE